MGKFNTATMRPNVFSPIQSETAPGGRTYEGAPGYARDAKSALFLLAVSNMVGESTFYEQAKARDDRYCALVRHVTELDADWCAKFLAWLRGNGNMRSASLVGAAEFCVKALELKRPGGRQVVASVLQRADEPAEMLAYWTSKYGRKVPIVVKKGIADAVLRLYTEASLLKYDSTERAYRFGDVIELVHPNTDRPWQNDLFRHAMDRRHNRGNPIPDSLRMLHNRAQLMAVPVENRRAHLNAEELGAAGMTWEALAGWLQGPMDRQAWEVAIPNMGLMALIRNLRNFDQAGVSDQIAAQVTAKLADAEQVAKSRQFPFRFHAAHANVGSLRWGHALEQAMQHSLANVPSLSGRTLVLVDQSPSMFPGYYFSTKNTSDISLADKAKLFGSAVALKAASATLIGYGIQSYEVPFRKGDAVLRVMERFHMEDGTNTLAAVQKYYASHDRVVIVTDEQTGGAYNATLESLVPPRVPVYTWNLAGYQFGHGPAGRSNMHTFGGMTDAAFRLIPQLEAARDAHWPWQD